MLTAKTSLDAAATALRQGDLAAAESAYADALRQAPGSAPAMAGLAQCARRRGDRQSALLHFGQAVAAEPGNPWLRCELGTELRQTGQIADAKATFAKALRLRPGFGEALIGLALCARERGDLAAAITHFTEAATAEPGRSWFRFELGTTLRLAGRSADAEAAFASALRLRPGFAAAQLGLALCARDLGARGAALSHLEEAADAAPRNAAIWAELGVERLHAGRLDDAEAAFRQALQLRPDLRLAREGIARCAARRSTVASEMQNEKGVMPTPTPDGGEDVHLALDRAEALRLEGRIEQAAATYAALLGMRPGLVPALVGLGLCARRQGARTEARDWFQKASQAAPASVPILLELAMEQGELGDLPSARQTAQAALAIEPTSVGAWMRLGVTERRSGNLDAARSAFARAMELRPAALPLRLELAEAMIDLGEVAAAQTLLEAASGDHPDHAAPLVVLARLFRQSGRAREAIAIGRRANAAAPAAMPALATVIETLLDLGRTDEALAELSAAEAQVDGADRRAALEALRILALRRSGRIPEAVAAGRAASSEFADSFAVWHARCIAELRLGDVGMIVACIAAAPPRRTPAQVQAHAQCLAEWAELQADHATAERHLHEAMRAAPVTAHLHDSLARLALRRWDAAAARRHLTMAAGEAIAGAVPERVRSRAIQTLLGQILEETALTPGLADALATALDQAGDEVRIDGVAALLRANPDVTAAAMALLVALRRKGVLGGPPSPGTTPIPPVIAQYVEGMESLAAQQTLASWERANPGFAFSRFDMAAASAWLAAHAAPATRSAFLRAEVLAQRADIFRLAWLSRQGGVWVEAASRCYAPLDAMVLPSGGTLVGVQDDLGSVGVVLLAATPELPLIADALDQAVTALNRGDAEVPWLSTGPGLLTRVLARAAASEVDGPRLPAGVVVHDRSVLLPYAAFHLGTGGSPPPRRQADQPEPAQTHA